MCPSIELRDPVVESALEGLCFLSFHFHEQTGKRARTSSIARHHEIASICSCRAGAHTRQRRRVCIYAADYRWIPWLRSSSTRCKRRASCTVDALSQQRDDGDTCGDVHVAQPVSKAAVSSGMAATGSEEGRVWERVLARAGCGGGRV